VLSKSQPRTALQAIVITVDQAIKEHKPAILRELLKQQALSRSSLMVILRIAEDEAEQTRAKITLRRKITSGSLIAASAISTMFFLLSKKDIIKADIKERNEYRKQLNRALGLENTLPYASLAEMKSPYHLPSFWSMGGVAALIGLWSGATLYCEKLKDDMDDLARAQKSVTVVNEIIAGLPQEPISINNKGDDHV